jgi:hypothetical protein
VGLLSGVGIALLAGGVIGTLAGRTKYLWVQREFSFDSNATWKTVVRELTVKAAERHHLVARRDEDEYVAYAPTLARPVAAGPLTVSTEYLTVAVTRTNDNTLTITGPRYMVRAFAIALDNAGLLGTPMSQWNLAQTRWTSMLERWRRSRRERQEAGLRK